MAVTDPPVTALPAGPLRAVEHVEIVAREGVALTFRATKPVDVADPYMEGHFPDFAIYPGVFVLETVIQGAAAALGAPAALECARSMRFTAPLVGSDTLVVEALLVARNAPGAWAVDARCRRSSDGVDCARIKLDVLADA